MKLADLLTTRKRLQLTQEEAADMLCVTSRQVRRWETGEAPMPKYMLELWTLKTSRRKAKR